MQRVTVYNMRTKAKTVIPVVELSPDMVHVHVEGVGPCYVRKDATFGQAPLRHPPFDEGTRTVLRFLKTTLEDVRPLSLREWEDGFRRDTHPDREIRLWVQLVNVYLELCEGGHLDIARKREVLQILLLCTAMPLDQITHVVHPSALTRREVEGVIAAYESFGEQVRRGDRTLRVE